MARTLAPNATPMKTFLCFALLLTVGSILLTGCTTVPQDTTVRRDVNSSSTRTYSK